MSLYKGKELIAGTSGVATQGGTGTGGGHIIQDTTQEFEQKEYLKFNGAEVKDTAVATEVITPAFERMDPDSLATQITGVDNLPIGAFFPFGGTIDTVPTDYLPCLGGLYRIVDYPKLFSILGTRYGGDGVTTFGVPDMRDKVPIGKSDIDTNIDELGKVYGEKTHKLTVSELAKHTHTITSSYDDANYNHGIIPSNTSKPSIPTDVGTVTATRDHTVTNITGGDIPHNNMQPSLVANYIIKAKQSRAFIDSNTNEAQPQLIIRKWGGV